MIGANRLWKGANGLWKRANGLGKEANHFVLPSNLLGTYKTSDPFS